MIINEGLKKRRSIYALNKELPISESELKSMIQEIVALVPDAFDIKSQRVIVALGEQQDKLWDAIYDVFDGKVKRNKIDGFKAAAGTILYFYDEDAIDGLKEQFPSYASNFDIWKHHANGMLQINLWSGLREVCIGANIQHYNPLIDETVKKMFNVPDSWKLLAQMPFGGFVEEPDPKEKEDIDNRVKFFQ